MGSANSRRRNQMADQDGGGNDTDANLDGTAGGSGRASGGARRGLQDAGGDADLSTILSYLIRSGQVRLLSSSGGVHGVYEDANEDFYDDFDEDSGIHPEEPPRPDPNPDTRVLDSSELKQKILLESGQNGHYKECCSLTVPQLLQKREVGMHSRQCFSSGECAAVTANYIPNKMEVVARYHHKAFCGTYSQKGNIFLSACQDRHIRIYDTSRGQFKVMKLIQARDVGWSVLDTAFSPDGNYIIYSSWSDYIHMCNIHGEHDSHSALHLFPASEHSFCIFSLCFSQDNIEIMGGANDGCMYVYNRERNERTLRIEAHEDDVNTVAFADESSHILFSGADDGLCKVWDRRTLREEHPIPVGVLAGHSDGITYIDSKGDARYLVSNSKDQTIKLWDVRHFSSPDVQAAAKTEVARQNWDYRWQQVPRKVMKRKRHIPGDSSLMTYTGHCVLNTLVRCRFSPRHTTGQRYIYTGCATGAIIIYDVLTGKVVKKLNGHQACVRDISWHPYDNELLSTSWDGTIAKWTYMTKDRDSFDTADGELECDDDDDTDEDSSGQRRSKRLRHLRNIMSRSGRGVTAID